MCRSSLAAEKPTYDPKKVSCEARRNAGGGTERYTRVTLQDVKVGQDAVVGNSRKRMGPRVKGRLLDGLRGAYDQADKIRYKR